MRIASLLILLTTLGAAETIWIEGEAPSTTPVLAGADAPADHGFAFEGWGDTGVMSGGRVLHVQLDPGQVKAHLGEDYVFGYDFELPAAGARELWARIGYEWARSEFEWRLDGGAWQVVGSEVPTIDVQPIQTWNELGWLRLAQRELAAGAHRLEFRFPRREHTDDQGKTRIQRVLAMLDCLCISAPGFRPQGRYRPGEDHRGEDEHAAAAHRFAVATEAGPDGRAWTELSGWWEYAAHGETAFPIDEATRLAPVTELPDAEALRWFAYRAPGDRDRQLPAEALTHRYLLRCRFDLPAAAAGRGCFLDVQRSNLIISVFVNGAYAGWTDTFHTAWQLDLTPHLRPGETNELVLAVKDAYYSLNPVGDPAAEGLGNRRYWNLPRDFLNDNQGTTQRHDYPVASDPRSGILEPASLVLCGPAYASDVFAQPSVREGRLDLAVELFNPGPEPRAGELRCRVEPWDGGPSELTIPAASVALPAGEATRVDLGAPWAEPRLWWPDDPHLYAAVTELVVDGAVVDVKRTRFGFREWTWDDHLFRLNGVKWQLWADTQTMPTPQQQVELMRESGANQLRYWRSGGWGDMTRREALKHFDRHGIMVRSSGTFDGQRANYGGGLREMVDGERVAKRRLWDHWREQMTAWVREERNHPSIYIWSVENEIAYINVNNLGQWRECEPELTRGVEHVMALDPTRPAMVDGGNALRDESLPVNGAHYTELYNASFRDFPDAAYTRSHWYDPERPQRGAWRMVPDRPIMKGEVYFANGYTTDRFATIGGERCFIGVGETMAARGLWARMLSEGYRWAEVASWHFWLGNAERSYWTAWQPVVVLSRQWDWTWGSGQTIERELRTFNGTRHATPVTMAWSLELDGARVAGGERELAVPPGEAESVTVDFELPSVEARTEGRFTLSASRDGAVIWRDEKPVSVLAPAALPAPAIAAEALGVIDPGGTVATYLERAGIGFTPLAFDDELPAAVEVVLIGPNAIGVDASTDTRWLAAAAAGRKVVVLDQRHPLAYAALPGDLTPTAHVGRFGFSEDLTHPIFRGLEQRDFFTWGDDHVVYRHSYDKGTRGGRSLFQCDDGLGETALFESRLNDGLLVLCQLAVGSKIDRAAVAQQLLRNLIAYAADYVPLRRTGLACVAPDSPQAALLAELGLEHELVADPLAALRDGGIAIVDASPANLAALAAAEERVDEFVRGGGWLMLWGATPEGLADFNRLVDHQHVMRPFDRERVLLAVPADPLTAGLTLRDVVMDTGKKMYPWMALKEPDREAWGHLVDHDDIAPFATFPAPTALGKQSDTDPGVDHWPRNMVNGFTSDDNWSFTYTIIMDQGHSRRFTLELPKREVVEAVRIRPSKIYHPITELKIYFDDDPEPVVATIPVREQPLAEDIPIEGREAQRITLEVSDWAERGDKNIVVIDNLWLQVRRDEAYRERVSSLLNIGGLMVYREGRGGILLNQLRLLPQETNPDNAAKKAAIVKTLLANLGAVFAGGGTEVDHRRYAYHPVAIPDGAFTAYATRTREPAWFSGAGDLSALPVGERRFARTPMLLSDFSTSPVPSVFVLRGEGSSTGEASAEIALGRRADSLFLLHTFHPGRQITDWQRRVARARQRNQEPPAPPVVLRYRVRYADGSEAVAEVGYGREIGRWDDPAALPLPGAALAWSGESGGGPAAVWLMRWDNPHPEREITSVTAEAERDQRLGAAAVLAVTAAEVVE